MRCSLAPVAAVAVLVASLSLALIEPADAAYRMCAFRQGACTCKTDNDGPGEFSPAPRSRCQPAAAAATKTETPAEPDPNALPAPAAAEAPAAPTPDTAAPAQATAPSPAPALLPAEAAGSAPIPPPETTAAISPPAQFASGSNHLEAIRARGKILCGVNVGLLGFSIRTETGAWTGIDADFCRAVAAAALGDADKVDFVPVETVDRFDALKAEKFDLLSRNTTWTMNRDVDLGLAFAGILYFDGQGFMTRDDRGLVSAQQLSGLKVCVEAGTTTEKNMAYYFKTQQVDAEIKPFDKREELLEAYKSGACDAYSGDRSALYADRAGFPAPLEHAILPEVISKEPLGPVVMDGDRVWLEVVRWTLNGLVNAEEVGLDKASAGSSAALPEDQERLVAGAGASGEKLGLKKTWLRDVVAAVGNYGEMFEANLGKSSPLGMSRGVNALWKRGGLLYAPPMW